jgi:hypothetical protein
VKAFPNFQAIATTLRHVKSASINDWSATLWTWTANSTRRSSARWKSWTGSVAATPSPRA